MDLTGPWESGHFAPEYFRMRVRGPTSENTSQQPHGADHRAHAEIGFKVVYINLAQFCLDLTIALGSVWASAFSYSVTTYEIRSSFMIQVLRPKVLRVKLTCVQLTPLSLIVKPPGLRTRV